MQLSPMQASAHGHVGPALCQHLPAHVCALIEVIDAAHEGRVDDEPLQRDLEHERRQQRMHAGVVGGVEGDRPGAVCAGELERAQRHRTRLVGAQQDGQIGRLAIQHLGRAVAELGRSRSPSRGSACSP